MVVSRIVFDERLRVTNCEKFTTLVRERSVSAHDMIEFDVRFCSRSSDENSDDLNAQIRKSLRIKGFENFAPGLRPKYPQLTSGTSIDCRRQRMQVIESQVIFSAVWLERVKGIEPSYSAWKAAALPLSYTRVAAIHYHAMQAASTALRALYWTATVLVPPVSSAIRTLNSARFGAYIAGSTNNERR
jgi:hypothetical protein